MNYLSHFVFNHDICGLAEEPYFAAGVVLPDLWLRFSRQRRIRWKAVRAATPRDTLDANLRAGLLNHADVDKRFHTLPQFAGWQAQLRARLNGELHPAVAEFLAHMAVELALDHRLLCDTPRLVDRFYDLLSRADASTVAERMAVLGAVDTRGLDGIIRQFLARRFLRHYRAPAGLCDVVRIVFSLAGFPAPPPRILEEQIAHALRIADPPAVWEGLVTSYK